MRTKATIAITTYNSEKYIRQTIESVLAQETNFEYRIIIGDDCSSDGTIKIIKELESRHKGKILLIENKTNTGSLSNSLSVIKRSHSKYISFLDGDDYWLGTNRLQRQVDFLDNNPDFNICGGNTYLLKDSVLKPLIKKSKLSRSILTEADYIAKNGYFVHTSSILLRNNVFTDAIYNTFESSIGKYNECVYRGENARFAIHIAKGKAKIFDDFFSVYRIHNEGCWQGSSKFRQQLETAISAYSPVPFISKEIIKKQRSDFWRLFKKTLQILAESAQQEDFGSITKKDIKLFSTFLEQLYEFQPPTENRKSIKMLLGIFN